MNVRNQTCLFCRRPRQILVDDSCTGKAIQKIYNITLPTDGCRICIECHFNIGRIREFKHSIDRCSDFEVDSCFVCKSENTVNEPGVDRVVDYLLKQCTAIDIGNTDTVRACTTCLYLLEICIKYEKLARNYASCQRFCKQFSSIRECNVALGKIDLDTLGDICANFEGSRGRGRPSSKKGHKRGRGSWGSPRDDNASKRAKKEDGSVMPVMLTKLTPTMTPAAGRPGKKSLSPDSGSGKKGKAKTNNKIFIKLPGPRKLHWKKHRANRVTYEAPHSPSITIPVSPSVDDLNRIFNVELRPLSVRIEHVDLSSYLNRTISHDKTTRHPRKPKKEEFIGLDEEDVVELQQNNTGLSSVGKRKSILVTERIESPNSAKKKVKFSDSPSIKYVDKLNFSDDDDEDDADSEDQKDADYKGKPGKKKSPQNPQNGGTPENGKPRRGRPKKQRDDPSEKKEENATAADQKDADEPDKASTEAEKTDEECITDGKKADSPEPEKDKTEPVVENGNGANEEEEDKPKSPETTSQPDEVAATAAAALEKEPEAAAMDTTEEDPAAAADADAAPMAVDDAPKEGVDQPEPETNDEEMKEQDKSPEDVEMAESGSPDRPEDVEMKEEEQNDAGATNHVAEPSEDKVEDEPAEKEDVPAAEEPVAAEFETSDREDEIEEVKQCLNNILGEQISDSEPSQTGDQSGLEEQQKDDESAVPSEKQEQDETEPEAIAEPEKETEQKDEAQNTTSQSEDADAEPEAGDKAAPVPDTPEKKDQTFSSLDDVDDISDDDDILDQLDEAGNGDGNDRKRSPDLPPLGEDSL